MQESSQSFLIQEFGISINKKVLCPLFLFDDKHTLSILPSVAVTLSICSWLILPQKLWSDFCGGADVQDLF